MKRKYKYSVLLILFFAAFVVSRESISAADSRLKFIMLDVGEGDSIFIETPSGNQVLVDGGPDKKVLKELGSVMPFYDRALDLVVLTHPNLDHIAGLVDVLNNYKVGMILDTGDFYALPDYEEFKKLAEKKGIKRIQARRGMKLELDTGTEFSVLWPEQLVSGDPNYNSVISKLSFGETDFLLTGDAEKGEELSLVSFGDDLKSEVLKVGHHGSKTSSNPLFLDRVRPEYALISVGRKNKFGHPSVEVMNNLGAVGAKIFRTDLNSRIEIRSDGKNLTLETLK
ncbi:MBL fold metallo-hydrolase [Candidatus Giovannonibacteria bacterium]|nr:MBL fold metallo-hydrolase [Candidatus Giovannonibacteria bacterium]